jgi:hypothetical protein
MNAGLRRFFVVAVAVLGLAAFASSASAKTEEIIADSDPNNPTANSGWQAGTCTEEPPEKPEFCSIDTPDQFYEQAAGRPVWGFTQFIVRSEPAPLPPMGPEPIDELQQVMVDLPQGLSVNPQATPQCALTEFKGLGCKAETAVGESLVTGSTPLTGITEQLPAATVYNLEPKEGQPALFGFKLGTEEIFIEAYVAWDGDYHEGFYIDVPEIPVLGPIPGGLILKQRLRFRGRSGDGTYITTPTTCFDWENDPKYKTIYSTYLRASGVEEEANNPGYEFPADSEPALESPLPKGKKPLDCPGIPYDPTTAVAPNTATADSPSGAQTEIKVPHLVPANPEEDSRSNSMTKEVKVGLPVGMGLNPSAANGLVACTDAQFNKGSRGPSTCPSASKIGTIEIETPPLPAGSIKGNVYAGEQKSRDPASGEEYRIFVVADAVSPKTGKEFGVSVRLVGNVSADPVTGQLTTRFSELPQVPFSAVKLKINDGPRSALTSPFTCGPHVMTATMTPWSGNPDEVPTGEFVLTSEPGGGPCAKTLGERPFAPSFAATAGNTQAGGFTDTTIDIVRSPGNQELKGVDVTLPPGLTAKLAGLRYCPEATISAAAANSGVAEAATPSCPSDSLVGSSVITAGSGPEPLRIDGGKAFLAGPYNGAPLSLAVITPATAGPFDLGTVVVRVALRVDRKTAQVTADSDPLPHVYGGALLDVRSVTVKVDRPGFALNGTNCGQSAFAATLQGGGANPNDPAAFSSVSASSPYAATNCEALPFKPKLFLRTFGATKRAKNPKLRAILIARPGDANIGRAAVTLPKSIILDQGAIGKVCTRVEFTANKCPADSVYGFAEATTPLLDGPLKGPVYLRSSDNTLPDLVADLHGQVDIELAGRTDSVRGRIRNTFDAVPDTPVSRFVLTIRGGKKKGLLVNSQDLCRRKQFAKLNLKAQNGKQVKKKRLKVRTSCKKKKKKKHHRAKAGR